jgi:hypothetical protein
VYIIVTHILSGTAGNADSQLILWNQNTVHSWKSIIIPLRLSNSQQQSGTFTTGVVGKMSLALDNTITNSFLLSLVNT